MNLWIDDPELFKGFAFEFEFVAANGRMICGTNGINTLRSGDAYQRTWLSLVQVMAWHLFGAKPLLESMT